mmetsp:Transcript_36374/g.104805  ORF Transcript_36374/g.104805 Transcript_36374/m.104805 type:complete len:286 (-) Transcript_36374:63-920(-)
MLRRGPCPRRSGVVITTPSGAKICRRRRRPRGTSPRSSTAALGLRIGRRAGRMSRRHGVANAKARLVTPTIAPLPRPWEAGRGRSTRQISVAAKLARGARRPRRRLPSIALRASANGRRSGLCPESWVVVSASVRHATHSIVSIGTVTWERGLWRSRVGVANNVVCACRRRPARMIVRGGMRIGSKVGLVRRNNGAASTPERLANPSTATTASPGGTSTGPVKRLHTVAPRRASVARFPRHQHPLIAMRVRRLGRRLGPCARRHGVARTLVQHAILSIVVDTTPP